MRLGLLVGLAGLSACAGSPRTSAVILPAAPPETAVDRDVGDLAGRRRGIVTTGRIGVSREGRPLHLLTIARPAGADARGPESRPALLIVAGLDGRHGSSTAVAIALADRLAEAMIAPPAPEVPAAIAPEREAEAPVESSPTPAPAGPIAPSEVLDRYTVYIIPQLNPDAAAWRAEPGRAGTDVGWAMVPDDADHDGRIDEDGPLDLNGDGVVTMMRVKNPPPGWGLEADMMIDPADARIMRAPDRMKGERAEYAVLPEGSDADGDGRIGEDAPGGVDLDMNFPYRWPEFASGAGRTSLSEPESRALAEWMLKHPNIVAVLTLGAADNLVNLPAGGQMDWTGQVPTGIENDDRPYHEKIAESFKEITKQTGAPSPDAAGSLRGWAYAHFGVFSFSASLLVRPDQIKSDAKPEEKKEGEPTPEAAPAEAPEMDQGAIQARMSEFMSATPQRQAEMRAEFEKLPAETRAQIMASFAGQQPEAGPRRGGRRGPGGRGPGAPPGGGPPKPAGDSDDSKWLKYSDESRAGAGFIAWQSFDHPQLGPVEIGGFMPGFKVNPLAEEVPRLADEQAKFVGAILTKLPSLKVQPPMVEVLGGGVWRISVRLVNEGFLPTRAAIGVKARRLPPMIVRLDLPDEAVISGERAHRVPALPGSGGTDLAEWVVTAPEGSEVKITISAPEFGEQVIGAVLQEEAR